MSQIFSLLRINFRFELLVSVELSFEQALQQSQFDGEFALLVAEPFKLPPVVVRIGVRKLGHSSLPLVDGNTLFKSPQKFDVKQDQFVSNVGSVFQHFLKFPEGRTDDAARGAELVDEGANDGKVGIAGAAIVT